MRKGFTLDNRRTVNEGQPALLIAEIAQEHQGSYALAHAMIEAAASAGADAVKFQCHVAHAESDASEAWRVRPRWQQDASRYEYWKRMEFTPHQWKELRDHAVSQFLLFIVSPFSVEAVDMLGDLPHAWKVASGEIVNTHSMPPSHNPLLPRLARTSQPVIISTGMATKDEILTAALAMSPVVGQGEQRLESGLVIYHQGETIHHPFALLHCTSLYPTSAASVGLNLFTDLRDSFTCPVGISDHTGTIYPALAAVALGASIVELHVTFDKRMGSFDTSSAVTFEDFKRLRDGVRVIEAALLPIDRDERVKEPALREMRGLFGGRWKR